MTPSRAQGTLCCARDRPRPAAPFLLWTVRSQLLDQRGCVTSSGSYSFTAPLSWVCNSGSPSHLCWVLPPAGRNSGGGGLRAPPHPGADTLHTGPIGGLCCVDLLIYLGSYLLAEGTPWSPHPSRPPAGQASWVSIGLCLLNILGSIQEACLEEAGRSKEVGITFLMPPSLSPSPPAPVRNVEPRTIPRGAASRVGRHTPTLQSHCERSSPLGQQQQQQWRGPRE